MLSLIVLAAVEIILFFIGVITNPIMMVIIPLGFIILWLLINNPAIALMILSLTAIIKGYLINYFHVVEVVEVLKIFDVVAIQILFIGFRLNLYLQLN